MEKKYSIQEGLLHFRNINLLFEQNEEGFAEVEDYDVKPGFSTIKIPTIKNKAIHFP